VPAEGLKHNTSIESSKLSIFSTPEVSRVEELNEDSKGQDEM